MAHEANNAEDRDEEQVDNHEEEDEELEATSYPRRRQQRAPSGGGPRRGSPGRRFRPRRKVCSFCVDKVTDINYKDVGTIQRFLDDHGKIIPRRKTGTCAKHQRRLAMAIKQARHLALLPFAASRTPYD